MKKSIIDIDARLGIVGTSGSGKTFTAGLMVEELLEMHRRVIVVDPLGVWYGLRLQRDGVTPSSFSPVIFGGRHGDVAITENSGQIIGETVAGMAESCILDLSEFGVSAVQRRFMLAFLRALYQHNANSVHLVMDEADMWAPQVITDRDGDAARLLGIMETVVRRGRVKGFRPWLITQRPAVLSKNVLSQVDGLIAMKLTSSQDRAAIGAWVEGQADKGQWKDLSARLPTLQTGTGIIWMPADGVLETVEFPLKKTYDSSRTPKHGEAINAVALRPVDIGALRDRLASVEQETKANDPKALKAEIARLKSEMQKSTPQNVPSGKIDEAHNSGYTLGYNSGKADGYLSGVRDGYVKGVEEIGRTIVAHIPGVIQKNVEAAKSASADMIAKEFQVPQAPTPLPKPVAAPMAAGSRVDGRGTAPNKASPSPQRYSPAVRSILAAIHNTYPIGLSFDAAARRAGVSKRSSAYRTYRATVMMSGEVTGDERRLVSLPEYAATETLTPIAGLETWIARVTPSLGKMLRAIADGHQDKPTIASIAGVSPTSSGLGSGLRELVDLELVVVTDGRYTLAEGL